MPNGPWVLPIAGPDHLRPVLMFSQPLSGWLRRTSVLPSNWPRATWLRVSPRPPSPCWTEPRGMRRSPPWSTIIWPRLGKPAASAQPPLTRSPRRCAAFLMREDGTVCSPNGSAPGAMHEPHSPTPRPVPATSPVRFQRSNWPRRSAIWDGLRKRFLIGRRLSRPSLRMPNGGENWGVCSYELVSPSRPPRASSMQGDWHRTIRRSIKTGRRRCSPWGVLMKRAGIPNEQSP